MHLYSALAALLLAITHLFAERLKFSALPRSKWLSFAGGVSVSYIFVHILPELEEHQRVLSKALGEFLKYHSYLIALLGLAVFYGLERAAKLSVESNREDEINEDLPVSQSIYGLHIGSFALYNALIGYLLVHRDDGGLLALLYFFLTMAFHFLVNDYGLVEHYRNLYRRQGRWVVSGAIIGGFALGTLTEIPESWISVLFAFVAGSTILNVLKEELPEERKSNFWAFAIGLAAYTGLLLLLPE
jgi:zinc transporter ZupT